MDSLPVIVNVYVMFYIFQILILLSMNKPVISMFWT